MFRFSEKPTKTFKMNFKADKCSDFLRSPQKLVAIFLLVLTLILYMYLHVPSKLKERLRHIFAAFSEHLNFNEILSKFFL